MKSTSDSVAPATSGTSAAPAASCRKIFAAQALLPQGWARSVEVTIQGGWIISVETDTTPSPDAEVIQGALVPGIPDLHSHAFQRAFAGHTERRGPGDDDFWTWRRLMYRFAAALNPAQVQAIAAQLYVELLKRGYTSVAEFHYLHHNIDGTPYDDPAEMSGAILAAAQTAGISLTLLPTLYAQGGFGGAAPKPSQRRFLHDLDGFSRLLQKLQSQEKSWENARFGIAFHSLRAVSPEQIVEGLALIDAINPKAPIHIHVAEQIAEVEACLRWSGQRPVAWLLDHAPVSPRWCLIHATHLDSAEVEALAKSGATVGLCPSTEANLGDGIFPAAAFLAAGGRLGIGSDSNVCTGAAEELRMLEYTQRLALRRRTVIASPPPNPSVGSRLLGLALAPSTVMGTPAGRIAPQHRADLLVLKLDTPTMAHARGDTILDAWIFATPHNPVQHVMVGGWWVIRDQRHSEEERIARDFIRACEPIYG